MKLNFEEFVEMQPERIREVHTRDEIYEWYQTADENNDGKLSVNEFFMWSLNSTKVGGATILEEMFRRYDTDKVIATFSPAFCSSSSSDCPAICAPLHGAERLDRGR